MTTITLTRPIQAHGEELRELTLREPTGKDLRTLGLPFTVSASGQVNPDSGALARHIGVLAGIPPSSVDQLSATDFMTCTVAVLGFFGAGLGS